MKYKEHCCMCGKVQIFDDLPPPGGKCLCRKCYKEVKKEYAKQHPGQSLRIAEIPESKKPKVQ